MVLSLLRKKARSLFIYIAFGIIIVVFIFYFGWGRIGDNGETWAAKVNDLPISSQKYLSYYKQMESYYRELYKDAFTSATAEQLGLKEKALDSLIEQSILLDSANETGVTVPKERVQEQIQDLEVFQTEGRFDLEKYRHLLRTNRITPQEFEEGQVNDMMVELIQSLIQNAAKLSERELWEQFVAENERVKLDYVEIDPAKVSVEEQISDEEAGKFYEENKEQFRVPDKVKIQYVEFSPKALTNKVAVTDEEIQNYYNEFADEYREPERVRARHILIRVQSNAKPEDKEKARQKAADVLAQLGKGASFEALATQYSEDKASAQQGGDLGFFPRGQMVKPFEEAAFQLEPGKISDLVESPFGYHIIKVEEKKPEGVRPLEEVKETIRKTLFDTQAAEMVKREAFRTYRSALKNKDLKGYAEGNGLSAAETDYFSQEQGHPILAGSGEALQDVFSVSAGELVYPFSTQETFYVAKVMERRETNIPEFESVKENVKTILQEQHRKEAAREKAKALLSVAKEGGNLEDAAKKDALTVKSTRFFNRTGRTIPDVGLSPEMMNAAFSLTAKAPYPNEVFEVNGKMYVIKQAGSEGAVREDFEKKKGELAKRYGNQKKRECLDAWLQYARAQAEVVLNPKVLN